LVSSSGGIGGGDDGSGDDITSDVKANVGGDAGVGVGSTGKRHAPIATPSVRAIMITPAKAIFLFVLMRAHPLDYHI